MGFWASYNRSLKQSPLLTKIATGVVGTILGDGLAQYSQYRFSKPTQPLARKLHERSFQYDHARLLRLLFWSAAVGTPIAHFWFQFLDMRIMPGAPTSPLAVVCKLVLDQGLMAPLGTALFFMGMKVLEGQPHRALPEVKEKLWPVMLANWAVWPLANAINFAIIPPSQRILYVNVLAVVWTAFMSHMANKPAVSAAPSTSLTASSTVARSSSGHKQGIAMLALEPASDVDGKHL
ncbi:40S ribosomal protein S17, partial [Haematococcus lacustris]